MPEVIDKINRSALIEELIKSSEASLKRGKHDISLERHKRLFKFCNKSASVLAAQLNILLTLERYDEAREMLPYVRSVTNQNDESLINALIRLNVTLGNRKAALRLLGIKKSFDPEDKKVAEEYKSFQRVDETISKLQSCYDQTLGSIDKSDWKLCLDMLNEINSSDIYDVISKDGYLAIAAAYNTFSCLIYGKNGLYEDAAVPCNRALTEIKGSPSITRAIASYLEEVYITTAESHKSDGSYKSAVETLERAVRDFPRNGRLRKLLSEYTRLMRSAPEEDFYTLLGVSKNARASDIDSAYRALARKYHPDTKPDGPERERAMDKMAKINEARETLMDPQKRAEYDNRGLGGGFFGSPGPSHNQYFYPAGGQRRIIIHNSGGPYNQNEQYYIRFTQSNAHANPFASIFDSFFARDDF